MSRAVNRLPVFGVAAVAVVAIVGIAGRATSRSPAVYAARAETVESSLPHDFKVPGASAVAEVQVDDETSARQALAHELRSRPGEAATDAILALLRDDAPEVRLAAAEALEARADKHSLIAIAAHVEDEDDLDVEGALRRAITRMTAER